MLMWANEDGLKLPSVLMVVGCSLLHSVAGMEFLLSGPENDKRWNSGRMENRNHARTCMEDSLAFMT